MFQFQLFHGSRLPEVMPEYETSHLRLSCLLLNTNTWCMKVPPKSPFGVFPMMGQTADHHKNINSFLL